MARHSAPKRMTRLALIIAALLGTDTAGALAATVEHRDYAIFVDAKPAGQSTLSITTQDDGAIVVSGKASVRFTHKAVFSYSGEIQATEWWKGGRLVGLKAHANENGKRSEILATADANGLKVRVNAQERNAHPESWVNSFWKLADPRYHNKQIPILEADSGKQYMGQLAYIGVEQVEVAKQPLKCYHFRVTGGSAPIDLWFDDNYRLVRQEFTEQGHRVIVQLTAVRR